MKTKINTLLTAIAVLLMLQSCKKDTIPFPTSLREDKLLLSKVDGSIEGTDANFIGFLLNNLNTYLWSDYNDNGFPDSGLFRNSYAYLNGKTESLIDTRISEDSFLYNGGHYDFLYNGLLIDKVVDNSVPGWDQGYWKYYYNRINQINKTGLAFSSTTDPVRFELYSRNFIGQIKSFVYEINADTPYMKVLYQYDGTGNISRLDIYLAYGANPTQGFNASPESRQANIKETNSTIQQKVLQQKAALFNLKNKNNNKIDASLALAAGIDTSVYYFYLSAMVTTDGRINPYSQQNNILFYQTNR